MVAKLDFSGLFEAIFRQLYAMTAYLRYRLGSLTWGPAIRTAKRMVLSLLSSITIGTLIIVDETSDSQPLVFGQVPRLSKLATISVDPRTDGLSRIASRPHVKLVVKNEAFWMRLFLFADMGFAEAYMLGEVDCTELTSFFELFIANRDQMSSTKTWFSSLSTLLASLTRATNTLSTAQLNVSAHYDISNELFAAFLSPDMTYSCPVWKEATSETAPDETLEEAQITKLHRFIHGAKIKPTDHVLEIGTGWGSFAIEAVRMTGCRITSLTLSREQKALADERIAEAKLTESIKVLLMDYRELPVPETPYDKVVSIEMVEAVGEKFLGTYFQCIDRLLKKKGGIAMIQSSTMPEGRHTAYSKGEDFINHYIFPGSYVPSTTQLLNHITSESKGTLIVEKVENIGGHYAKTLRLWKENFLANFDSRIRPALKKRQDMTKKEIEIFRRKWEYYFAYCEGGFRTKTLGAAMITVGREGATELLEGIAL